MDTLDRLLQQVAAREPRPPRSRDCLGADRILDLIDHPEQAGAHDREHLGACRFCQRAMFLAREHRDLIESPLPDEDLRDDASAAGGDMAAGASAREPRRSRGPLRLARPLMSGRWALAAAAVLVLAVGITWWAARGPGARGPAAASGLIVAITGDYLAPSITRAPGEPEPTDRIYEVQVELRGEATLSGFYLDDGRQVKLVEPQPATEDDLRASRCRFQVWITRDDPPGTQWIGIVASAQPLDPDSLRSDLQRTVNDLPPDAPLTAVMDRLDADLQTRPGLAFKSHRFAVPAPKP